MDIATLGLSVNSGGAVAALQKFTFSAHNAGTTGTQLEKGLKTLGRTFGSLGALLGTRQLMEYSDTWQLIHNRINLVTNDTNLSMTIQQKLFEVSQRTRNSMAATAVLYSRLALSANELGRSHQELIDVTESVNAAMLRGGATGVEAAQSMRQLAQAFSKGKLDGDEFRTVMEAMPEVANAITAELKITKGELYELSAAGKITTNEMIDALLNARARYVASIENMPITFSQAWIVLSDAVERVVGIFSMAIKTSTYLGNMLKWVRDNLNQLIAAIGGIVIAFMAWRGALFALISVYELYMLLKDKEIVKEIILAALRATSIKGLLLLAAASVALGVGLAAYEQLLLKLNKATDAWTDSNEDLNKVLGEYKAPVNKEDEKRIESAKNQMEDMIRLAKQEQILARRTSEEQARMQIVMNAINKTIEAKRDLQGDILQQMIETIAYERDLLLDAHDTRAAFEASREALSEALEYFERFKENAQKSLAEIFEDMLMNGLNSSKKLFDGMKQMFFRMVAEMAAADVMKKLAGKFATLLGVGATVAAAATPANATPLPTADELQASILAGMKGEITVPVEVKKMDGGIISEMIGKFAKYLGPAILGFSIGSTIGGMTSNRVKGTLGGAAAGAAAGAAYGSVVPGVGTAVGAIIGGITGAIGGFLGSSKRNREEMEALRLEQEKHRLVLAANNLQLEKMRAAYEGRQNEDLIAARAMWDITRTIQKTISVFGRSYTYSVPATWGGLTEAEKTLLLKTAGTMSIALLDENGKYIAGTLQQLGEAIEQTIKEMTQFGRNLKDIESKQTAYNKIFGIEETPQRKLEDAYATLSEMTPDLMRQLGLANLDLTTEIGRNVLTEGFKEIFNMISSGQLSPELLGAFTDKNQLLDSILKVVDGLGKFNEELFKVTTDFPRAMDIIYYENKFGRYGESNTSKVFGPVGTAWKIDNVTIVNEAGDTGEDILNKVEAAAYEARSRGGVVAL